MTGQGLAIGDVAPDFTLRDQLGQDVALSSFRGKKAVTLLFYPFAFSGVCTGELGGVKRHLARLQTFDSEVLAISCDPVYSLSAFADQEGLNFSLLSDFWPHGEVCESYGVFYADKGHPKRSSFIIDVDGTINWLVHNEPGQARDIAEHVRHIEALSG